MFKRSYLYLYIPNQTVTINGNKFNKCISQFVFLDVHESRVSLFHLCSEKYNSCLSNPRPKNLIHPSLMRHIQIVYVLVLQRLINISVDIDYNEKNSFFISGLTFI